MDHQARLADNTTVVSTSTRNGNNRLGHGAQVHLDSPELAAECAQRGRIPSKEDDLAIAAETIDPHDAELYRSLHVGQIEALEKQAGWGAPKRRCRCWRGCAAGRSGHSPEIGLDIGIQVHADVTRSPP